MFIERLLDGWPNEHFLLKNRKPSWVDPITCDKVGQILLVMAIFFLGLALVVVAIATFIAEKYPSPFLFFGTVNFVLAAVFLYAGMFFYRQAQEVHSQMQTLARYLTCDLDAIKKMSESDLIRQCRCRLGYLAWELSQLEKDGSSPVDHLDLRNTFRKSYNFFQECGLVDGGWGQFFPKKQEQS